MPLETPPPLPAPSPCRAHPRVLISLLFFATLAAILSIYGASWLASDASADAREAAESNSFFDPALNAETKRRGEAISGAIQQFRAEKGQYPASLDELVPAFMPEIPPPVAGRSAWRYHSNTARDTYTIAFGIGDDCYPCSWYPSGVPEITGWYDDS